MKAAVVKGAGESPLYMECEAPHARPGHRLVDMTASALSRLAQGRASGTHYSSGSGYPFVVGVDGVGRLDDGQRVYIFGAPAPFGTMAERTIVPDAQCVPLPDGLDDITAAAIAIPGMSSWAALIERARFAAGETVLVNGATGTSGRLAVRIVMPGLVAGGMVAGRVAVGGMLRLVFAPMTVFGDHGDALAGGQGCDTIAHLALPSLRRPGSGSVFANSPAAAGSLRFSRGANLLQVPVQSLRHLPSADPRRWLARFTNWCRRPAVCRLVAGAGSLPARGATGRG